MPKTKTIRKISKRSMFISKFCYFQDEIDDSDEYETVEESDSGDDYEYDNDNSITS